MIYTRIKTICKEQGRSVRSVEADAGLTPNSVCKWDDSAPSIYSIAAVAEVLGVSLEEFLRGDEDA